jgi:hypothetical protein
MTDAQATALGRFCGLSTFCKENSNYQYGEYVINKLIEILNEYERTKHETNSNSISCGTKAILTGAEKQPESAL